MDQFIDEFLTDPFTVANTLPAKVFLVLLALGALFFFRKYIEEGLSSLFVCTGYTAGIVLIAIVVNYLLKKAGMPHFTPSPFKH